jgi:hypothetical protein
LSIVGLLIASSLQHYIYLLRRNDSERQRFLYRDDGKRVFPRRKFVEVDSKRDDLFSGHWIKRSREEESSAMEERGGLDGMGKKVGSGLFI